MGSRLKVQFGDPQHGWMALTMQSDVGAATLNMSYVGFDTLDEMIEALHALITGDHYRSVRIMEEPTVCELQFRREDGTIRLHLHRLLPHNHFQPLFDDSGTFAEICLPFWRALRNLQTRFSTEEFGVRWHRPFPLSGMEKLSVDIQRLPR
jgi:hypothetical protein